MKYWVDDIRPAPEGWTWLQTVDQAAVYITLYADSVEAISLDHDLGSLEASGYDIACMIECLVRDGSMGRIKLTSHSANPVGKKNIEAVAKAIERYLDESDTR